MSSVATPITRAPVTGDTATVPPGYKRTEVGVIPADWHIKLLPDVCRFRSGKAHEQYISEFGRYVCINSKFISTDGSVRKYATENFCCAHRHDIVMVMSDLPNGRALAKAFFVDQDALYAVNQRVCALTSYRDFPKYLFYILNRNPYFLKFDDGVNQTHLLNHVFQHCPLALPPSRAEQRAIAGALSDVDALVEALEKLIAKKRAIKQAAMQQLLTGKTRLPGFNGEWRRKRLDDLLDLVRNGAVYVPASRCGLPVSRIETISDGFVDFSRVGYAKRTAGIEKYKMRSGDILYSHINSIDHIGKVALFTDDHELYHGMNLLLLRCSEFTDTAWLYYVLCTDFARQWARSIAKQAVSQASINTKEIKNLLIQTPSQAEQTAIANVLTDMHAEIAALERRRDKTKSIKQGMMQQLLTGRIRLIDN